MAVPIVLRLLCLNFMRSTDLFLRCGLLLFEILRWLLSGMAMKGVLACLFRLALELLFFRDFAEE